MDTQIRTKDLGCQNKMQIKCITSMNKGYYDAIGKLMIASWSKYWSKDIELIVYQEGFEIENFDRVTGVSWEDHCEQDWKEYNTKVKGPATRFAKKGFTMISGMKHIDCDWLIWLDADLLSQKEFPRYKLESLLPKEKLIAFFDTFYQMKPKYTREEYLDKSRVLTAAESGFVIMNKKHKKFNEYAEEYERLYKLPSKPTHLGDWYDGNVCAAAATNLREYVEDLSLLRTTDKSQTPINRSWIREYCYHAKAKQKRGLDIEKLTKELT